jgi:glutamate--cysteine ligase
MQLVAECEPIAARLDRVFGGAAYADAVAAAGAALDDPESVPSARVLHAMQRNHGGSYLRFVLAESLLHRGSLAGSPLPAELAARYDELARASLAEQRDIEASDRIDFETWRRQYLNPANLRN